MNFWAALTGISMNFLVPIGAMGGGSGLGEGPHVSPPTSSASQQEEATPAPTQEAGRRPAMQEYDKYHCANTYQDGPADNFDAWVEQQGECWSSTRSPREESLLPPST